MVVNGTRLLWDPKCTPYLQSNKYLKSFLKPRSIKPRFLSSGSRPMHDLIVHRVVWASNSLSRCVVRRRTMWTDLLFNDGRWWSRICDLYTCWPMQCLTTWSVVSGLLSLEDCVTFCRKKHHSKIQNVWYVDVTVKAVEVWGIPIRAHTLVWTRWWSPAVGHSWHWQPTCYKMHLSRIGMVWYSRV